MIKCDIRRDLIKCDTYLVYCNNFKVADKKLCDVHLISKLTDWNPKILQSENVYLL